MAQRGKFSYSGDPANSRLDAVRSLLSDTGGEDGTAWILADEEIIYFDGLVTPSYDDPFMTAAVCADIIGGRFAAEVSISADGVSVSTDQLQEKYRQLAASLRTSYQTIAGAGGYPYVGGIEAFRVVDPAIRPKNFALGMDDNIRAGSQEQEPYYEGVPGFEWLDSSPW